MAIVTFLLFLKKLIITILKYLQKLHITELNSPTSLQCFPEKEISEVKETSTDY